MKFNSKKEPLVSVIMPVFNQAKTLELAILSICNQTFKDWELILIDDFSSDESISIMKKLAVKDMRLKIIQNKKNFGLAKSLNIGIDNSNSKYVARMDADDISESNRFKKQVRTLNTNSIDVLGSNATLINSEGLKIGLSNLPLRNTDIVEDIYKRNPFIHSSVMMKRSFLTRTNGYDNRLRKKQDYDLWVRGLNFGRYKNLKEPLLMYRAHEYKEFSTDFYGFYVRIRNGYRGKHLLLAFYWACIVLLLNLLRKFGYRSKKIKWY